MRWTNRDWEQQHSGYRMFHAIRAPPTSCCRLDLRIIIAAQRNEDSRQTSGFSHCESPLYCDIIISSMHPPHWTRIFLFGCLIPAYSCHHPSTLFLRRPQSRSTTNTSLQNPILRQPVGNLTVPNVHCNGDLYRHDLDYHSCADALFQIPRGDRVLAWDSRYSVVYRDVGLPYRWISGLSIYPIPSHRNDVRNSPGLRKVSNDPVQGTVDA